MFYFLAYLYVRACCIHAGEKAIDCLLASKWSKEPKDVHDSLTPYFKTRANAIDFCFQWVRISLTQPWATNT